MEDYVIYHHGIKGQRWGVRRYQNEDGTRTAAGKKHEKTLDSYVDNNGKSNAKQEYKQAKKQYKTERKEVRAESKQNAKDIRKNMSVGKKVATTVLGGPLGSVNYANYKAAGYSDKKALGKTYIDGMLTGGLSTGHSTRVRNKAAEREHFN